MELRTEVTEKDCSGQSDYATGDDESEGSIRYSSGLEQVKRYLFLDYEDIQQFSTDTQVRVAQIEEDLYRLRRRRSDISRKETELMFLLQDALLQEDCARLTHEMKHLEDTKESRASEEDEIRKQEIVEAVVSIVNRRDSMLSNLHAERIRTQTEESELDDEYKRNKMMWKKILHTDVMYDLASGNVTLKNKPNAKSGWKCCCCTFL